MSLRTEIHTSTPSHQTRSLVELSAERSQDAIVELGGTSRIIANGEGVIGLKPVFDRSLLGVRSGGDSPDPELLSVRELELLRAYQEGGTPFRVLTLVDIDGVLVSPAHAAVGGDRRIGYENLRWLAQVARTSDRTVVWTSRFMIPDELQEENRLVRAVLGPFQDRISYFPFIDSTSITNLERLGCGKLSVQAGKLRMNPVEFIRLMIRSVRADICYYVGSSYKDRRVVIKLLRQYPEFAKILVFFDTGHVIL